MFALAPAGNAKRFREAQKIKSKPRRKYRRGFLNLRKAQILTPTPILPILAEMVEVSHKNTTPALVGGGVMSAGAGFESARSAYNALVTDRIASKQDLVDTERRLEARMELLEERMTRKSAQQHNNTIMILGGMFTALGVIIVIFEYLR